MPEERDTDHVEVFADDTGEWRWHRKAANGKIIMDSGEGYKDKSYCKAMAEDLNPNIPVYVKH